MIYEIIAIAVATAIGIAIAVAIAVVFCRSKVYVCPLCLFSNALQTLLILIYSATAIVIVLLQGGAIAIECINETIAITIAAATTALRCICTSLASRSSFCAPGAPGTGLKLTKQQQPSQN